MRKFQLLKQHGGRLGSVIFTNGLPYYLIIPETITPFVYPTQLTGISFGEFSDWYVPSIFELVSIFSVVDCDVLIDSEYYTLSDQIGKVFITDNSFLLFSKFTFGSSTLVHSNNSTEIVGVTLHSNYTRCSLHEHRSALSTLIVRKVPIED